MKPIVDRHLQAWTYADMHLSAPEDFQAWALYWSDKARREFMAGKLWDSVLDLRRAWNNDPVYRDVAGMALVIYSLVLAFHLECTATGRLTRRSMRVLLPTRKDWEEISTFNEAAFRMGFTPAQVAAMEWPSLQFNWGDRPDKKILDEASSIL